MASHADRMQLRGRQRIEALARCEEQMGEWGLKVPAVAPLVLGFGVGDFYRVGLIEYWLANEIEKGYCGKYMFLFGGQTCPAHSHVEKHETFFVVRGELRMTVDGVGRTMSGGDVQAMPPGQVHSFSGIGPALVLEMSTPCIPRDNRFEDSVVADWLAGIISPDRGPDIQERPLE